MKLKYFAAFIILLCTAGITKAQQPYYTKLDSVGAAAVVGTTDSMATFVMGKIIYKMVISVTNATTGDTLKGRALWYGNSSAYKTVSWKNLKSGAIDSVLIVPANSGLVQVWELLDSDIDNLQIYSAAGTYVATRKSKVYFKYRK